MVCGSPYSLEAGHVFGRGKRSTRWDPLNVFAQCHDCNQIHVVNKEPYYSWYIKKFGQEAFDALERKSNEIYKWTDSELRELLIYFVEYEKKLEVAY